MDSRLRGNDGKMGRKIEPENSPATNTKYCKLVCIGWPLQGGGEPSEVVLKRHTNMPIEKKRFFFQIGQARRGGRELKTEHFKPPKI